jgi:hypothetical protein
MIWKRDEGNGKEEMKWGRGGRESKERLSVRGSERMWEEVGFC